MKVLIVDDRPDNQLLLQEQLRGLEAETVVADSGVRALHEVRSQSFDLVVTDLLMPEMDGFQLCYLLKTDPRLKRTPVIIYTANYATRNDEQQAKSLGADDFITRPVDEEVLSQRIREVLRRAAAGEVNQPRAKPEEGFFREYSTLLVEKLEDQLITAEENARLLAKNIELQSQLEARNAALTAANVELERVNEDLEAFSYSVSHDLRAPVRAIQGMLGLLVEKLGPALTPEAQFFVRRIEHNAERMNTLISGLLAHSRMRHVSGNLAPVDLNAVVATTLGGLDFAIREARARVSVSGPLPRVLGHEQALVQVVTNLVDNGVKFVPPGKVPEVNISATVNSDRVRLNVRDNGIGIPAEYQSRLFQVFERLVGPDQYPGTGIGLAIVRRGIERMGGRVGVESSAQSGSCFWVELKPAS